MSPDRWLQVKAIVADALEHEPAERLPFVEHACGSDAALRDEVTSLLSSAERTTTVLDLLASDIAADARDAAHADDTMARVRTALEGRYAVERELGRGGMATVYLARDRRHRRPVALKVLDPHLSAVLGPARFMREIETAASLSHPHILPLFDSGSAAGLLYFVMPYVAGESLRERLRRVGRLPTAEALRILREMADALDYAHRHGVVHRDVKPENVLLDEDGHAFVADFGIARAVHHATGAVDVDGAPDATLTQTGVAIGTPAYMSPEQALGERDVDGRSDVYALGCVAFELLAGEAPFRGTSAEQLARRLTQPPPALSTLRPDLSSAADATLGRALALGPEARFPTAMAFTDALGLALHDASVGRMPTADAPAAVATARSDRANDGPAGDLADPGSSSVSGARRRRSAVALTALVLVAGAVGLVGRPWRAGERAEERAASPAGAAAVSGGANSERPVPRVAVLPFENLGRPEDAYFADGMADEVRGRLATLRTVAVIARASSNQYRGTRKPPDQIARELGVQYLLTGTVRSAAGVGGTPGRVRVNAELVRISGTGAPVAAWQEPFEADRADVFQVQADVAQRVVQGLDVEFGADDQARIAARPTTSLAAYDAFLQGEHVSNGFAEQEIGSLLRAIRFYERAVALDTAFALAWSRLAVTRAILSFNAPVAAAGLGAHAAARRAAEQVLRLAPQLPDARLATGYYQLAVERDAARAAAEFMLGLRESPNDPQLLTGAAWAEQTAGRIGPAVEHLQRAIVIDPRSVNPTRWLGIVLLWGRRHAEARAALERALSLGPSDLTTLHVLGMVAIAEGDLAGARAALRRAPREVDPVALVAFVAWGYDMGWMLDDAQQRLLLGLGPDAFGGDRLAWGLALAEVHGFRGDMRTARVYADSAYHAAATGLRTAPMDPQLHALGAVALAYLGRRVEAVRMGRRALELTPVEQNVHAGAYHQHQLARVHVLLGEPEAALDALEPLLRLPYYLTPAWLRIDPTFTPLRGHPRFERLVAGAG